LEFWASSEIFQPASAASEKLRRMVEPLLNTAFANSILGTLPLKLRYVPIIMPEGMRERYPARSKVRKNENLYDCAPQLDYEVFVAGAFGAQVDEYFRGIALSAPHLADLGASQRQIDEFKKILKRAAEEIGRTGGIVH
jgi:hypothetical protein